MNADDESPGNGEPGGGLPRQGMREEGPHRGFWDLLSPAEQAALRMLGQVSVFRHGDAIITEGALTTDVLVLTEGWVKVSVTGEHHEKVMALRGQGDLIGELAGSCSGYRIASVMAAGRVEALVITYDRFSQFLHSSPAAGRAYLHVMTQRWGEAADMLRSRSVNNGAQRLAGLLLDLAGRHGTSSGSGTIITLPLSQAEIADFIGTSRATVTRALRDWRRHGLIGTARRQITIISTPGMRSAAGRDPGARMACPLAAAIPARLAAHAAWPGHAAPAPRVRPARAGPGIASGRDAHREDEHAGIVAGHAGGPALRYRGRQPCPPREPEDRSAALHRSGSGECPELLSCAAALSSAVRSDHGTAGSAGGGPGWRGPGRAGNTRGHQRRRRPCCRSG